MRETQVRSLGREDPLWKEMATHFSTLAWKIPWTEERGRPQPVGWKRFTFHLGGFLCLTEEKWKLHFPESSASQSPLPCGVPIEAAVRGHWQIPKAGARERAQFCRGVEDSWADVSSRWLQDVLLEAHLQHAAAWEGEGCFPEALEIRVVLSQRFLRLEWPSGKPENHPRGCYRLKLQLKFPLPLLPQAFQGLYKPLISCIQNWDAWHAHYHFILSCSKFTFQYLFCDHGQNFKRIFLPWAWY